MAFGENPSLYPYQEPLKLWLDLLISDGLITSSLRLLSASRKTFLTGFDALPRVSLACLPAVAWLLTFIFKSGGNLVKFMAYNHEWCGLTANHCSTDIWLGLELEMRLKASAIFLGWKWWWWWVTFPVFRNAYRVWRLATCYLGT